MNAMPVKKNEEKETIFLIKRTFSLPAERSAKNMRISVFNFGNLFKFSKSF